MTDVIGNLDHNQQDVGEITQPLQKKNEAMMKTILVPTDFSECAGHALDYAIGLAKGWKAKIILLHCSRFSYMNPHMPYSLMREEHKKMKKEIKSHLKTLLSDKSIK